ncbi:MAG: DUF3995 domain-containing protein [Acidimicrobiia bacterium]
MATRKDPIAGTTSALLAGIGVLHVLWGLRAPIPGVDAARVADAVVGSEDLPSPRACFTVAAALAVAAGLVAGAPSRWPRLRRIGQTGVAVVLGGRALLGATGRTDLVAPGPTSERFEKWDRALYTPLCFALSAGAARAACRAGG